MKILKKGLEQSTLWVTQIPQERLTISLAFIALQSSGPSSRSIATQERLWTSTSQQGSTLASWRRSMRTILGMISECAHFQMKLMEKQIQLGISICIQGGCEEFQPVEEQTFYLALGCETVGVFGNCCRLNYNTFLSLLRVIKPAREARGPEGPARWER